MGEVSAIGLDIAKSVFQVHGVDDPSRTLPRGLLLPAFRLRRSHCGGLGGGWPYSSHVLRDRFFIFLVHHFDFCCRLEHYAVRR